jgi:hypothetical protein
MEQQHFLPAQWQALANIIMSLQFPYEEQNFATDWLIASQGFCSMDSFILSRKMESAGHKA